ncbi:DNA cytosine methyltransferase [Streptomyces niveus]|uniref:DNA cytosine methyltransferase n=1 Tax=Streptomyces niveus TaxID=193462 RepID=UPI0035D7132C
MTADPEPALRLAVKGRLTPLFRHDSDREGSRLMAIAPKKKSRTATHRPAVRRRRFRHDDLVAVDLFCVDEQTEILTAVGWKRYDDLTVGDVALTIRPDGSAAEWQPVEAVNVFPAERRKMQLIDGRGVSALTTDNHRWLSNYRAKTPDGRGYRWRVVRSDELTCDDRIPMSAPVANLPTEATVPDALVELVAWYWTEGTDRSSGRVHIVQDDTVNPQHVNAICSALETLFGPEREKRKRPDGPLWAENRWGTQTTFGLNREASAGLREAAPGKVPSVGWLATLTQRQLDLFIQRSLDADGHERVRSSGRLERVLVQGDLERASAFQAACLIAGHAASMKRYKSTYRHGNTVRAVESWAVTVGMREFVKPLRQKRVEWVEHDGIVWCPTTPNGTWLARRNGTSYFTGNSGFGGLTEGIKRAGFTTIMAANHNSYKVEVHEANHPEAEHWIADLVDPEAADYHSARDLPAADLLVAGVSCVNHSRANTIKAYEQGMTLFELDDPDFDARVTRSERDRATANCVLHYAARHHPRLILIECTTELTSWGPAVPGRPKVGDGSTYRWWLKQFGLLGYRHKVLYLNSMFFGVPQSRNRAYWAFWDKSLPTPDLDYRPVSRCHHCDKNVEAVWTWKTGIPPTGSVNYGKQYEYRCPSCRRAVVPPMTPSLAALDLSTLGQRIGDRKKPLAPATLARAERCRQRFADFPAILMPTKAHEKAVLLAVDNYQGGPRGVGTPLPTQVGSETLAVVSSGIVPYRKNTVPTVHGEAMPTVTSDQIPGLLSAAGWFKQNGSTGNETAPHPLTDPLGTLTAHDTTALVIADWQASLAELPLEECYFRMMAAHEIGRGCGFDVDFSGHKGTFTVWGSASSQVDGFGNAVSPQVGAWIGSRLRASIHADQDRARTSPRPRET